MDKTVHISKDLHKILSMYALEKDKPIGDCANYLITEGLQHQKEDLPDYLITQLPKVDLPKGKKVKEPEDRAVDLGSDLNPQLIKLSEDLEGGKLGTDQTIKEITLNGLRYLKNRKECAMKDFVSDVHPKVENEHSQASFKKLLRSGLQQIEELGAPVKTPRGRGHAKYEWTS